MTDIGEVWLADLNEERRRRVLIVSAARFNRAAARVVVVPEIDGGPDEVPFPWRIEDDDGTVYAVDFVRAIPGERLLELAGRASSATSGRVQRAIRTIM